MIFQLSNSFIISISVLLIFVFIIYILVEKIHLKLQKILLIALPLLILISVVEIFNSKPKFKDLKIATNYNVIFIIFDEHTSPSILKKEFSYDYNLNIDSLHLFNIIPNSKSLYKSTFLSLNSLFSLDENKPKVDIKNIGKSILEIQNNNLLQNFQNIGYEVNFYSILNMNNKTFYDKELNSFINNTSISSSLYMYIFNNFAYKPQIHHFFVKDIRKKEDNIREKQFSMLNKNLIKRFDNEQNKKFVDIYHFLIPHAPYNIEYDTINIKINHYNKPKYLISKEMYIENIKHTKKYIEYILDKFSKSSIKENTILIIQGDHGYRGYDIEEKNMYGILNIIYSPNQNYTIFNNYESNVSLLQKSLE